MYGINYILELRRAKYEFIASVISEEVPQHTSSTDGTWHAIGMLKMAPTRRTLERIRARGGSSAKSASFSVDRPIADSRTRRCCRVQAVNSTLTMFNEPHIRGMIYVGSRSASVGPPNLVRRSARPGSSPLSSRIWRVAAE